MDYLKFCYSDLYVSLKKWKVCIENSHELVSKLTIINYKNINNLKINRLIAYCCHRHNELEKQIFFNNLIKLCFAKHLLFYSLEADLESFDDFKKKFLEI